MIESTKQKINTGLLAVIFVLLAWIATGVGWLIKQNNDAIVDLAKADEEVQKQTALFDNEIKFMAGVLWADPDVSLYDKDILKDIAKLDVRGTVK